MSLNNDSAYSAERRRSERTPTLSLKAQENKAHELTKTLTSAINTLSSLHSNSELELKHPCTIERLNALLSQTQAALPPVVAIFDEIKTLQTPKQDLVILMDRLCRDNKVMLEKINVLIDNKLDENKDDTQSVIAPSAGAPMVRTPSIAPSVGIPSIRTPSSKGSSRSTSTRVSETLRIRKQEAAAAAAAKEAELRAQLDIATLQAEIEEKKRLLDIRRLKGELEAQNKRVEVFSRALEEEGDSVLMVRRVPDDIDCLAGLRHTPHEDEHVPSGVAKPSAQRYEEDSSFRQLQDCTEPDPEELRKLRTLALALNFNNSMLNTEPEIFSGDPLRYYEWADAMDSYVNGKGLNNRDKLRQLKKFVEGPAKDAISDCFFLDSDGVYDEARDILRTRFGDRQLITEAFQEKLENWPKIDGKDCSGLRKFSDFLRQCLAATHSLPDLEALNIKGELNKIVKKLPSWMTNRWMRLLDDAERAKSRLYFKDLCGFVKREADVMTKQHQLISDSSITKAQARQANRETHTKAKHTIKVFKSQTSDETQTVKYCAYCEKNDHFTTECYALRKKSSSERETFVRSKGLCYGCLKPGHVTKTCRHRSLCKICKKSHPTSLHKTDAEIAVRAQVGNREPEVIGTSTEEITEPKALSNKASIQKTLGCSMIVPVLVMNASETRQVLTYAMLDTQSDATFISKDLVDRLGIPGENVTLRLSTMTTKEQPISTTKVSGLKIRGLMEDTIVSLPKVYTRQYLPADPNHIPTPDKAKRWPHLMKIAEQIPPRQDCEIGLLIGYNCPQALAPRESIFTESEGPYAVRTMLGWSIVGMYEEKADDFGIVHRIITTRDDLNNLVSFNCGTSVKESSAHDLIKLMAKDFDEINEKVALSQEDLKFLNLLQENVRQESDGHISMPLPLKERPNGMATKAIAMKRLKILEQKFRRQPELRKEYASFMENIIQKGHAEKVSDDEHTEEAWYIPHFGVRHPTKKKLRVVFDASAKYNGKSLNDYLLQGPDQVNPLTGVLTRFREKPVAITCDVEQMFHQFRVHDKDRNYLRFIWYDCDGKISVYRMAVHLFGAKSSPACATFGLRYIASQLHNPEDEGSVKAMTFIHRDFYVDDGLTSVETVSDGKALIEQAISLCAKGGVRLHKFMTNDKELLKLIPRQEQAENLLDLQPKSSLPLSSALGVMWNVENDCFQFRIQIDNKPWTRRGLLSTVASVFDPLGFISPFTLVGKQILQEMCRDGAEWDDPLPENLQGRWERWRTDLEKLATLTLDRCLMPDKGRNLEVHHFSDASTQGYGQCSYLRYIDQQEQPHCSLICSKARVMPLKAISMPRAELQAAVLSTRMSKMVASELTYETITHHYWLDSKVVLGYINNEATRFHTYVANRVQTIRDNTDPNSWHYISTKSNPADHASRGLDVYGLINSSWFKGPEFLWMTRLEIPETVTNVAADDENVKTKTCLTNKIHVVHRCGLVSRFTRFDSWRKLITAVTKLEDLTRRYKKVAKLDHIVAREQAQWTIIRATQEEFFGDEIKALEAGNYVTSKSPLSSLNPTLDDKRVLRVGGRLDCGDTLSYEEKHPIILPKRTHIATLIARHYHEEIKHQGRGLTIGRIRAAGYWIVNCNRMVASVIHNCTTCRKERSKPVEQQMADLPQSRLEQSPPFTYVGADCFGPFIVKEGRKEQKKYAVLFTCLYSRAIHLELLDDLSTDSFINSLRNMVAIRGPVRMIWTDRGSNFIGACNELRKMLENMDESRLKQLQRQFSCTFTTNAPFSSHKGGVWERHIRTVRSILQNILQHNAGRINTNTLRTFLYEVMSIINSRPLTTCALNDPSVIPLTPNMLLTMKPQLTLPLPGDLVEEDIYSRKRWVKVQALALMFWQRWKGEYLAYLQARQKWTRQKNNLKPGDVVLITSEDLPRGEWPIGRVEQVKKGSDGLVRTAEVLVGNQLLDKVGKPIAPAKRVTRSIGKLIFLC